MHPRAFIRKQNFVHQTVGMVCYILVGYKTNSDIFFRLLVRFMITLFINEAQPLHHNFTFLHLSSFLRSYLSTYCCTFTCLSNRDSSWYVINYSFHYKSSILAKKKIYKITLNLILKCWQNIHNMTVDPVTHLHYNHR